MTLNFFSILSNNTLASDTFQFEKSFFIGLGFQQFLTQDSEMTQELVEEGKEHIKREKRRRQRLAESASRRKEISDRFGPSEHIEVSGMS